MAIKAARSVSRHHSTGAVGGMNAFRTLQTVVGRVDYSTHETNYTLALATLRGGVLLLSPGGRPLGVLNRASGLLADTRASLKKLDAVLVQVEAVAANAKEGTADLGALRAEVESNLRRVEDLVNEINRKWPFARNTELRLP